MSMVDAVAKCLHEYDHPDAMAWRLFSDEWRALYIARARVAIRAMMEHDLVYRVDGQVIHELRGTPNDIWKTMLAAALTEDGGDHD